MSDYIVPLQVTMPQAIVLNEIVTRYEETGVLAAEDEAERRALLFGLAGALERTISGEWQEPGYDDRVRAACKQLLQD
jgi:hypothetical protein